MTTKWKGPSVQPLLNVRKQQGNLLETVTRSPLSLAEKNSANTRHLAELARPINPRTYLLQDASEITFIHACRSRKIGITAGASTPQEIIEEAIVAMETMEELLGQEESMKLHIGMIVEGTVINVTKDEVVVNFGYQSEGSVPFDQWVQGGTKETCRSHCK